MTNYTVEELEEKILNGENVSQPEFLEAMRNREATDRYAELTKERITRKSQADAARLQLLKNRSNDSGISPKERLTNAFEISDLEKQINAAQKPGLSKETLVQISALKERFEQPGITPLEQLKIANQIESLETK